MLTIEICVGYSGLVSRLALLTFSRNTYASRKECRGSSRDPDRRDVILMKSLNLGVNRPIPVGNLSDICGSVLDCPDARGSVGAAGSGGCTMLERQWSSVCAGCTSVNSGVCLRYLVRGSCEGGLSGTSNCGIGIVALGAIRRGHSVALWCLLEERPAVVWYVGGHLCSDCGTKSVYACGRLDRWTACSSRPVCKLAVLSVPALGHLSCVLPLRPSLR